MKKPHGLPPGFKLNWASKEDPCITSARAVLAVIKTVELIGSNAEGARPRLRDALVTDGIKQCLDHVDAKEQQGEISHYQAATLRDKVNEAEDALLDDQSDLFNLRKTQLLEIMLNSYCECKGMDDDVDYRLGRSFHPEE